MAENVRPPVAIRTVRPYATEDEFLENELETIGKASVILIGATARPTGVILRFEMTLAGGPTVLRGEGRVLGHKDDAFRGQPGLALRFTRLDPRSKALVDRATAMREARAPSPPRAAAVAGPTAATANRAATAASPTAATAKQEAAVANARAEARGKANANARTNARRTGPPRGLTPPPRGAEAVVGPATERNEPMIAVAYSEADRAEPAPAPIPAAARGKSEAQRASAAPAMMTEAPAMMTEAPPNRDELLARLRERAGTLPRERVAAILAPRVPR